MALSHARCVVPRCCQEISAISNHLSYMGDMVTEEEGGRVRGILVASGFDARAKAAARMVPALILRKYSIRFRFSDGNA